MIDLINVSKQFGEQLLFENVTFKINKGDRIALVGKNGVGKSTLFKILMNEADKDEGEIHRQKNITCGYLPQEIDIKSNLSILDEVLRGAGNVLEVEREIETLTCKISEEYSEDNLKKLSNLQNQFEFYEGFSLKYKAEKILAGLGFKGEDFSAQFSTLSGGMKMRVYLAKLLLKNPDLLLMDEPTNHLDISSLSWLEDYLNNYQGAVVIISHDRFFLNKISRRVGVYGFKKIRFYSGNYEDYLKAREDEIEFLTKQAEQQNKKIEKMEDFIEKFRYKATKSKQVQSRIKMLEKMDKVETIEKEQTFKFRFPQPPSTGRIVAEFENISKNYDGKKVYENLNFKIERRDRIALIGPNGAGKSTTLKILASKLLPSSGNFKLGHNVTISYYSQHLIDELTPENTVFDEIFQTVPDKTQTEIRTCLGIFGLTGDHVFKKVSVLSGGEKARVALTKILIKPTNFLLFDEPTNHLDMDARHALEAALNDFEGTLCFISHDRYFIDAVSTRIFEIKEGTLNDFTGNFTEFLEYKKSREISEGNSDEPRETKSSDYKKVTKRQEAEERNRLYTLKKTINDKIEKTEKEILCIEERLREIDLSLSEKATYQNKEKVKNLAEEKTSLSGKLEQRNEEWSKLVEELDKVV